MQQHILSALIWMTVRLSHTVVAEKTDTTASQLGC